MYFSNFPTGIWKATLFLLPAWTWPSKGPSVCFYRAVPWPTPQVCLVSWDPNPFLSAGSCYVSSGLREVPPGEAPRSLLWCHSIVKALHPPPFQGGPMGPAVTLAGPSTLKNVHQYQGAWVRSRISATAASSLCPSLPFLHPNFQRVCGRG